MQLTIILFGLFISSMLAKLSMPSYFIIEINFTKKIISFPHTVVLKHHTQQIFRGDNFMVFMIVYSTENVSHKLLKPVP